jgi:hypothetical protein
MKQRFLNQKMGKRTTRRTELVKTKNQAKRPGVQAPRAAKQAAARSCS